jgi:hypothetical protein
MSRMNSKVLLVGSIPGSDATDAMTLCGNEIGDLIECIPDGETGTRRIWINHLAASVYHGNPALETVNRPLPIDAKHPDEWRTASETWAPRGYDDHWQFRVKAGVDLVRFEDLGYANAAKESYPDFCALRDAGIVQKDARFMVALPLVESAIRPFFTNSEDFEIMWRSYSDALKREVMTLTDCIPSNDVVLQWDICLEVVAIETAAVEQQVFPWQPAGDPLERFENAIKFAATCVPSRTLMGLHLCYGVLGHRHLIEPQNLSVVTNMANRAAALIDRDIDYYHMPVPRDRNDDAYFEPLQNLQPGTAKLYLGLIHTTGGAETSLALLATAKKHATNFGVATECGFGRRPRETMAELFHIHRLIADAM